MNNKIITIIITMMLLLVTTVLGAVPTNPLEFGEGLLFVGSEIPEHHLDIDEDYTFMFKTFQQANGLEVSNQSCYYRLVLNDPFTPIVMNENVTFQSDWTGVILLNGTTELNTTGSYTLGIICSADILIEEPDVYASEGGYMQVNFDVVKSTAFGLWVEPTDWTFPIIYLILTIVLLGFALTYTSSIMGVLGSIMLIFAYFLIGATSPILFTPLLIVGFLLAFKFATLD